MKYILLIPILIVTFPIWLPLFILWVVFRALLFFGGAALIVLGLIVLWSLVSVLLGG